MSSEEAASIPDSGEMEVAGDRATLVFRRHLRHPPTRVWSAITDPAELREWYLTEARIEGWVGGKVELVTTRRRILATGRVLAWEPPSLYEHEWNVTPNANFPDGERAVVRWELHPTPGGTLLTVTHRALSVGTARGYRVGIQAFLERLKAQLGGEPLSDWEARVVELRARGGRGA